MATRTANRMELLLAHDHRFLDFWICIDHPSGDRESRLKDCSGSDIGMGQLVDEAITVCVDSDSESFFRLHSVMVIERTVGEFTQRYYIPGLVERPDNQCRRISEPGGFEAQRGNPDDMRGVPGAISISSNRTKGNSLGG